MEKESLRIAIPVAEEKLAMHFGHCEKFALIDVDLNKNEVVSTSYVTPPPHQPGILPPWLADLGTNVIITGGMGQMALRLFYESKIKVLTGAKPEDPAEIVKNYLSGDLVTGQNVCDH